MKVRISDIIVEDRFRKDLGNIEELAKSMDRFGTIHPIVVNKEGDKWRLIAGGRRLEAAKLLGWEEIEATLLEETNKLTLMEIELEENICRKNMTWIEEVSAKRKIHLLKAAQAAMVSKPWGVRETASLLGEAFGGISQDIQLAEAIAEHPELLKCKNKSTALRQMKELKLAAAREELVKRKQQQISSNLILGDCILILPTLPSDFVDLVITDPPWGIGIEDAYWVGERVEYSDEEKEVKELLPPVFQELFRIMKAGSHLYIFFGIQHYDWMMRALTLAGFEVDIIPGIWNKITRGAGESPYRECNAYEAYIHAWKGEPNPLNSFIPNVHTFQRPDRSKRIHSAEKPVQLLKELISNSSKPGDLVLDPFAGSASTLVAAKELGREALGIEKDPEVFRKANARLQEEGEEVEESDNREPTEGTDE